VHDLLVTVACGIVTRKLSTSPGVPGPHDFAVRSSRARRTRCQRPPHPASTFRDDRDTPLASRRDGRTMTLIWGSDKEKYFCERAGHRFAKFTCRANHLYTNAPIGADNWCGKQGRAKARERRALINPVRWRGSVSALPRKRP